MKRFESGNNPVFFRTPVNSGIFAGEFDRPLVGLGPAVAEKDPVSEGVLRQQSGQLGLLFDIIQVGNVHQFRGLFGDCTDYRRVAVAQGADGQAGQKIKIFFAPGIPDARSRPFHGGQGQTAVCFHDIFIAEFDNLFVSQK